MNSDADRIPEPKSARREPLPASEEVPAEDALTRFERANSEFEDLPPGAYLRELRVGNINVVWGALNIALTCLVLWSWSAGHLLPESEFWLPPADAVWLSIEGEFSQGGNSLGSSDSLLDRMLIAPGHAAQFFHLATPETPWWLQAKLVWTLLPISSLMLGLVTLWQKLVSRERATPKTKIALAFAVAGGLIWWIASRSFGVDFAL